MAVLYTPENEHFGIVPIEAMYMVYKFKIRKDLL